MRMRFNVYAGHMFCGVLTVTTSGLHMYRSRSGKLAPTTKLTDYYELNLRRTS